MAPRSSWSYRAGARAGTRAGLQREHVAHRCTPKATHAHRHTLHTEYAARVHSTYPRTRACQTARTHRGRHTLSAYEGMPHTLHMRTRSGKQRLKPNYTSRNHSMQGEVLAPFGPNRLLKFRGQSSWCSWLRGSPWWGWGHHKWHWRETLVQDGRESKASRRTFRFLGRNRQAREYSFHFHLAFLSTDKWSS